MGEKKKEKKICFACSSGGHTEQIMMLKPLMKAYDSFLVTEKTQYQINTAGEKTYYLIQSNRKEKKLFFVMIWNSILSLRILLKERPDVIITTGVLAIVPLCIMAKWGGAKVIYIESFAKIHSPTLSGKVLYHFADQFYVQWESMLDFYPKAIYLGGIY